MAAEYPIKFRILQLFKDGEPHWNNEIVTQLQAEYDMAGDYGRDSINFDIIEVAAGGMIKEIEVMIDADGIYKKGALLHRYEVTPFGLDRLKDCLIK